MIVAVMPVYNRIATVRACLPAWARERGDMLLWAHDDGSTDAGMPELLTQHAGWTTFHQRSCGGAWGVATLIRDAIHDVLSLRGVEWIYVCDSDTYPCKGWYPRVQAVLDGATADAFSFYNSSVQARRCPANIERRVGDTVLLRRATAPGCSFMMRASRLCAMGWPYGITEAAHTKHHGAWDFILSAALGPVLVTQTSLVEHLGAGGLHNSDMDADRALNPTRDLEMRRPRLIRNITKGKR